jgi:hypothetical protein
VASDEWREKTKKKDLTQRTQRAKRGERLNGLRYKSSIGKEQKGINAEQAETTEDTEKRRRTCPRLD